MELKTYFIDSFKNGQFNKTEEAKSKSESGKIIKVFDGDVKTYLYELPNWYKDTQKNREELLKALLDAFMANNINNMGIKGSYEIVNNEIYFYMDHSSDDMAYYTVIDEDGDEFLFSYLKKKQEKLWLYHEELIDYVKEKIKKECGNEYANKFTSEVC